MSETPKAPEGVVAEFVAQFVSMEDYAALARENERLKQYVPSEKSDKEIARENAHLKTEIRRLQNGIDKLRLDMSASDARSDNWRRENAKLREAELDRAYERNVAIKERDELKAKLNEAKVALEFYANPHFESNKGERARKLLKDIGNEQD